MHMPSETFYAIVGSTISHVRQERRFTQEKLAKAVNLDRTSISNIEQGRQKMLLHSLYEIANALGVEPFDLLPKKNILTENNAINNYVSLIAYSDINK